MVICLISVKKLLKVHKKFTEQRNRRVIIINIGIFVCYGGIKYMSYTVFTDSCSNLPPDIVAELGIHLLPCGYTMDGEDGVYDGDLDSFDSHAFYEKLRAGSVLKTSLINTQHFIENFTPELEKGRDIVYVGLSSGVSGTYRASVLAAEELKEQFPDRVVRTVDSLGASLGTGLITCCAAELAKEGKSADEAALILDERVKELLQFFTVDDLNFLKRTGRVSGATAAIANVLDIKPLLWGDPTGHIVAYKKYRGRKNSIKAIAEQFEQKAVDVENSFVAISHGDCPEEAEFLAEMITARVKPKQLIIAPHEPFTGAHVGPGMIGLYFFGKERA